MSSDVSRCRWFKKYAAQPCLCATSAVIALEKMLWDDFIDIVLGGIYFDLDYNLVACGFILFYFFYTFQRTVIFQVFIVSIFCDIFNWYIT